MTPATSEISRGLSFLNEGGIHGCRGTSDARSCPLADGGGRMDSVEIGETLQAFRNPGEQLRGIIYVARGGSPPIVVEACPAVTVEFDEQEQVYVAVCDCFGVVGTARDEAGAVRELEITLRVFLSELLGNDCLHETLNKKGWMP